MKDTGTRINLQTGQVETFTVPADETTWKLSTDEIATEALQMLRKERDSKLSETDWVVTMHKELGTNIPTAMKTYRQALRDITDGATSLDDVTWPTKPS